MTLQRFSIAALLWSAGCSAGLSSSESKDLRKRLDEAQRQATAALHKTEELEDRVFLLTDQIESQKIAQNRRGGVSPAPVAALPVVTLRPNIAADERYNDADNPDSELSADGDVEYRGAALSAKKNHERPMLTDGGYGDHSLTPSSTTPRAKGKSGLPPTVDVPSHHDSLGVAAVPPIAAAGRRSTGIDTTTAPAAPTATADPLRLYREALNELHAGHHDVAEKMFRDFIKRFPTHDYADNAQYWLGEAFYARQRFAEAASEFQMVLATYPTGNKAPDAMLKLAYCMVSMGDGARAKEMLHNLPTTYPRTEAARLAEEKLAELGVAKESAR